jgi:hypothetical protein
MVSYFVPARDEVQGAATVFRGCPPAAADAAWVPALILQGQAPFDAHLVFPAGDKIVLVAKALVAAELEIAQADFGGIGRENDAAGARNTTLLYVHPNERDCHGASKGTLSTLLRRSVRGARSNAARVHSAHDPSSSRSGNWHKRGQGEVVVVNAHDRYSAYNMMAGVRSPMAQHGRIPRDAREPRTRNTAPW